VALPPIQPPREAIKQDGSGTKRWSLWEKKGQGVKVHVILQNNARQPEGSYYSNSRGETYLAVREGKWTEMPPMSNSREKQCEHGVLFLEV